MITEKIKMFTGDDIVFEGTFSTEENYVKTPIDTTDMIIYYTLLPEDVVDYTQAVIKLTEADMTTNVDGLIQFTTRAQDSLGEPLATGVYDQYLQLEKDGVRTTIMDGTVTLKPAPFEVR